MKVGTHNKDTLWLSTRFPHRPTHLVSLSPDVVIEDKAETGGRPGRPKDQKEKEKRNNTGWEREIPLSGLCLFYGEI